MLTLARCEDAIRDELGYLLPGENSTLECVNATGQWFVDAFAWSWLQRMTTLNTTSAQNYVDLSTAIGFRKLLRASYLNWWLQQTDLGHINALRATVVSTTPTYCAVGWSITTAGVYTPRLELYPTPSVGVTGAIQLYYTAGWQTPLSGIDTSRIAIPEHVEALYLTCLRAYAKGLREPDVGSVGDRLLAIQRSSEWIAKTMADGETQLNYGPLRGSVIGGPVVDETMSWGISLVPDP